MRSRSYIAGALAVFGVAFAVFAQTGPFDPEQWPTTINLNLPVHFIVTDGGLSSPGGLWQESTLAILTGGDQITEDLAIGGHTGKQVKGNYLNVADSQFAEWADDESIDILVQAYGDAALLTAQGQSRDFSFLTGTLPEVSGTSGGQVPVEAKNKRWNWILFRITNGIRASDGMRLVGTIPVNAQGNYFNGGVNGGTIRFESVPGLVVRVIAFGARGAFGEPEAINLFLSSETCDPEPNTNLAGMDIAQTTADHMEVLDRDDQTVEFQDNVGPAEDRRRAVRPLGAYLNFGIVSNYLGLPCNDPRTVKVCVEFYDDPAFAGLNVRFGPEAYATDAQGSVAIYPPEKRQVMEGTGAWIRRSWTVPNVNLFGVNAAPTHTAGPRFVSENGQVFVSRLQLAVLRTGDHPLAGQDPLADCWEDPNICTDRYGNFAELDLYSNLVNGLDLGSSGGDQEMVVEEAGPASDRRLAVRPAHNDGTSGFQHQFLNFAIVNQALGPSSQPNAHLAICLTYYDDPALVGTRIRPEVYRTERNGVLSFGYTPESDFVALEGSDTWKQAYWEIADVKFDGVNQAPQAAARFITADAGDVQAKIAVTRVQYGVIRPCGPLAGVNPLETCKPITDVALAIRQEAAEIVLSWPSAATGFVIQSSPSLTEPQWGAIQATIVTENDLQMARLPISEVAQYFRLAK